MLENSKIIQKLARVAKTWGGAILKVSPKVYDDFMLTETFFGAPFTNHEVGQDWATKRVIYAGNKTPWTDFIHEMGHCFASIQNPEDSDEFVFFGWEIALVHHLGFPRGSEGFQIWEKSNKDYVVTDGASVQLGDLSSYERDVLYKDRWDHAVKVGLIVDSVPRCIRA